jgi:hypothetical protein
MEGGRKREEGRKEGRKRLSLNLGAEPTGTYL